MELSIIILNYRLKELVRQCLLKIDSLGLPFEYEVIVVDNDSGDGCLEMVESDFPEVLSVQSGENRGFSAGNNLGIRAARGKHVLIMNPDVLPEPGSIEKLHEFMEGHPDCGLCGPKLLNADGSLQLSARRFPDWKTPLYRRTFLGDTSFGKRHVRDFLMQDWDHNDTRPVDWMLGACLLAKKEAVGRVGLLDERFFLYFEDVDWCRRFGQAGYGVYYVHDARMVHYHQQISAKRRGPKALLSPSARAHIASGIKYFKKYEFRRFPEKINREEADKKAKISR